MIPSTAFRDSADCGCLRYCHEFRLESRQAFPGNCGDVDNEICQRLGRNMDRAEEKLDVFFKSACKDTMRDHAVGSLLEVNQRCPDRQRRCHDELVELLDSGAFRAAESGAIE